MREVLERLLKLHSVRTESGLCGYCGRVFPCEEYLEIGKALSESD